MAAILFWEEYELKITIELYKKSHWKISDLQNKTTYSIPERCSKMNDIAELIETKIDAVVTSVLANKLDFLDRDNQFSPLMTQSEASKWLGVGDDTLKYYILKGMPVIKKNDKIYRIPRDAVKEWIKNEWRNI